VLTLPPSVRIYLASEPVDLRRGHDGLCAVVRNQWRMDPFAGHLFCFVSRRLNRIKILFWDGRGGFVVYYKRLERGRFCLPQIRAGASTVTLDAVQLGMLLGGIDVQRVRQPRHWTPPSTQDGSHPVGHG
jgi:transposase